MEKPHFTRFNAVLWAGLSAGTIEIAGVFAYWETRGISPTDILKAIASALMGPTAYQSGYGAAALGLFLHFLVSFVFAAAYIGASTRMLFLVSHPVFCGLMYGGLAKIIMDYIVVPLSRATFGADEPALLQQVISWSVHMILFGLPIALVASRVRR